VPTRAKFKKYFMNVLSATRKLAALILPAVTLYFLRLWVVAQFEIVLAKGKPRYCRLELYL